MKRWVLPAGSGRGQADVSFLPEQPDQASGDEPGGRGLLWENAVVDRLACYKTVKNAPAAVSMHTPVAGRWVRCMGWRILPLPGNLPGCRRSRKAACLPS
ncbi:MAG: hypothetical protein ACP5D1_13275 [Bacteroidales bacterium]